MEIVVNLFYLFSLLFSIFPSSYSYFSFYSKNLRLCAFMFALVCSQSLYCFIHTIKSAKNRTDDKTWTRKKRKEKRFTLKSKLVIVLARFACIVWKCNFFVVLSECFFYKNALLVEKIHVIVPLVSIAKPFQERIYCCACHRGGYQNTHFHKIVIIIAVYFQLLFIRIFFC